MSALAPVTTPNSARPAWNTTPKTTKGLWTKVARVEKAAGEKRVAEVLKEAIAWCDGSGKGPGQAAAQFPEVTVHQIRYALQQRDNPRRHAQSILTEVEQQQLADWAVNSARNINPINLGELSA